VVLAASASIFLITGSTREFLGVAHWQRRRPAPVVAIFYLDLKATRVPNFADIERVAAPASRGGSWWYIAITGSAAVW